MPPGAVADLSTPRRSTTMDIDVSASNSVSASSSADTVTGCSAKTHSIRLLHPLAPRPPSPVIPFGSRPHPTLPNRPSPIRLTLRSPVGTNTQRANSSTPNDTDRPSPIRLALHSLVGTNQPRANSSTANDAARAPSPGAIVEPDAGECELSKVSGLLCPVKPCPGHPDQDVAEVRIIAGVDDRLGALEAVLAEHGEDEYTDKCRAYATASSYKVVDFSRTLDDQLCMRREVVKDVVSNSLLRSFDRAAKRARKEHCLKLIANMREYLDGIETAFVSTIESQQGVSELDARIAALMRTFISSSTTAWHGPLRTLHQALKWLPDPMRKNEQGNATLTGERSGKIDKKTGKKTGKKVSHKQ